jgi:hypothetical protein
MMKKKHKKSEQNKNAGPTLLDRLPKDHGEWLQRVIKLTNRTISGFRLPPEHSLVIQIDRLTKELEEWRKNESANQKT